MINILCFITKSLKKERIDKIQITMRTMLSGISKKMKTPEILTLSDSPKWPLFIYPTLSPPSTKLIPTYSLMKIYSLIPQIIFYNLQFLASKLLKNFLFLEPSRETFTLPETPAFRALKLRTLNKISIKIKTGFLLKHSSHTPLILTKLKSRINLTLLSLQVNKLNK
jgi:hypothetical protein